MIAVHNEMNLIAITILVWSYNKNHLSHSFVDTLHICLFIFALKHHQMAIEDINDNTLPVTTFQMIIQTSFVQERFITSKVAASQSLASMHSAMSFQ